MIEQYEKELEILFSEKKDALDFLHIYCEHCSVADDLVDEPKSEERIKRAYEITPLTFAHPYFLKHRDVLLVLDRLIYIDYFNSVTWEKAEEEWKRQHAVIYSHAAMKMTIAVILLEFGLKIAEDWSLKIKEAAHERENN